MQACAVHTLRREKPALSPGMVYSTKMMSASIVSDTNLANLCTCGDTFKAFLGLCCNCKAEFICIEDFRIFRYALIQINT